MMCQVMIDNFRADLFVFGHEPKSGGRQLRLVAMNNFVSFPKLGSELFFKINSLPPDSVNQTTLATFLVHGLASVSSGLWTPLSYMQQEPTTCTFI
jgi:hypothetical protein